jgi:hypothetical protein
MNIAYVYLPRRRPCFECSLSLYYMKGKGYYAAIIEVNGNPQYMHKQCALERDREDFVDYVEDVLDAKEFRRRTDYRYL